MKQGQASHNGSYATKVEPTNHGVNPAAAADIGIQNLRTRPIPVVPAPAAHAPDSNTTIHHCGSQGKR